MVSSRYRIDVIDGLPALLRLEPEWQRLAERARTGAFHSPDWLVPWLGSFHGRQQLRTLVVRDGEALCGLLPLHRVGPCTVAAVGRPHTPETGVLLRPADAGSILRALLGRLRRLGPRCAVLELHEVAAEGALRSALNAAQQEGLRSMQRTEPLPCGWVTDVDGPLESFLGRRSRNFRRTLRRAERAAASAGLVVETVSTPSRLSAVLPDLERVSRASWQAEGGTHALSPDGEGRFYVPVSARFAAAGRLLVHIAWRRDVAAGYFLHVLGGTRMDTLKSEYDPQWARSKTGWLLARQSYVDAHERGIATIHMGSWPTRFKQSWADRSIDHERVCLFSPSVVGAAHAMALDVKRSVRSRRDG